jgi:hypothetical protein
VKLVVTPPRFCSCVTATVVGIAGGRRAQRERRTSPTKGTRRDSLHKHGAAVKAIGALVVGEKNGPGCIRS